MQAPTKPSGQISRSQEEEFGKVCKVLVVIVVVGQMKVDKRQLIGRQLYWIYTVVCQYYTTVRTKQLKKNNIILLSLI